MAARGDVEGVTESAIGVERVVGVVRVVGVERVVGVVRVAPGLAASRSTEATGGTGKTSTYLTTKFTSLLGTTMVRTVSLPSR